MFNPQLAMAAVLFVLASVAGGFWTGYDWANTRHKADLADQLLASNKAEARLRARADELSHALSIAEGRIITKTVEVIKHVPTVTTGTTPCLGPAAVSLLQPGSGTGIRPPASEPAAEGAAPLAASDRDVAYWIAEANQHYDTCAARLNGLIDFENQLRSIVD